MSKMGKNVEFDGFSVHRHDEDGDVVDAGIFLHFGSVMVKVANNAEGFRAFRERLAECEAEIRENYLSA